MPRIRPIRTQEEAEKVPVDQPLDIELAAEEEPKEVEVAEPEPQPEPEPKVEEPEPDLRQRLADLQRAETENRRLQQENADYQRRLQEAQAAQSQSLSERNDAYYAGILNAIDAAEAQAEIANRQITTARAAGDEQAEETARRNLSRADAALLQYEQQKNQYEEVRKARAEPQVEVRQPQQNNLEAAIAQYPEEAKKRFREHPEYVTNPRMTAKLVAAHWDAIDAGHNQYSAGYFQYLDDKVFEPKREGGGGGVERISDQVEQIKQRSGAVPAAPPTRDVPSASTGRPTSTRVTLTPEERDIARASKSKYQTVAEAELDYARQKLKYQEAKKAGQYQERG